ncbi:hypothetical protein N7376_17295 [Brucella intermedia GD04153]|uniref:Uncharacterized protein n=1 Tax=Brucella intermedia GD04153 TaxID=2975438 RepID=A0AA42GZ95_9HYPH|nr:hypothetical protein [Brucella intermedia]MDH0125763.1 hypothetical protein [Brucella intermedia GD04153]
MTEHSIPANAEGSPKIVPDTPQAEDPWMKSRRLSRELVLCLDQMDPNIEYVMICPASKAKPEGSSFIAYGPYNEEDA